MARDDDELPKVSASKAQSAHTIGQSLDDLSVDELAERIALLRLEIERLEGARSAKAASLAAASSLFKI
jgi:uncharacterized small protein (DUF1192 family)